MKTTQFVEAADEQTKLDVLVEIGSVTIRPSTEKVITVDATYRHMDVWTERQGDTVVVRAESEDTFLEKLSRLFNNDHPKADLVIHLPAHCEVNAKTITGKLSYSGELTEDNHRFETVTGEIVLTLPQTTNAKLSAKTTTGSLSCQLPLVDMQEDRHFVGGRLQGTLGSGAGRIKAKISTGSLLIRPLTTKQKEPAELKGQPEPA